MLLIILHENADYLNAAKGALADVSLQETAFLDRQNIGLIARGQGEYMFPTKGEDKPDYDKALVAVAPNQQVLDTALASLERLGESDAADGEERILLFADRVGNRLIEVRDPSFTYAELDTARGMLWQRLERIETPEVSDETTAQDDSETEEDSENVQSETQPIASNQ